MKKKSYLTLITLLSICIIALGFFLTYKPRPTRYAVFAGYNPNSILEPYILTYLKGLNEITDGIVYITDSPLLETEKAKLKKFNILFSSFNRHNEYDWGSYKRGLYWLKKNGYLEKADEIIFANDSTYAPLTSFKKMFQTMDKRKDLDFWGDSQNHHFNPHLQSYFLVFRKKVFNSKAFEHFMNSVHHQIDSSLYILEYEINLTPYLELLGYKWNSYLPYNKLRYLPIKDKNSYPLTLIMFYHHEFLKRRTFTEKLMILENIDELLEYLRKHHKQTYLDILSANHPRLDYLKHKNKD